MKKQTLLILALSIAYAEAASEADLTWETSAGGTVTIINCDTAASGDLVVPATLGGNPVVSAATNAFSGCTQLTSITFAEGLTTLGNGAFLSCTGLTTINLPSSLNSVSTSSFSQCRGLQDINVAPGGTNFISTNGILYKDAGLTFFRYPIGRTATSLDIPDGVTAIAGSAFRDATQLIEVSVPEGVTSIGISAFSEMTSLNRVTLPASLTSIGISAFYKCSSLDTVVFAGSAPSVGSSPTFLLIAPNAEAVVTSANAASFGGEGATWNNLLVTVNDPVTPTGDLKVTSIVTTGGASTIAFSGSPSTTYLVKSSTTLQGFAAVTTTPLTVVTDASGVATFDVDASAPKNFFIIEEQAP